MALVSAGVEVKVIDESQYTPGLAGSIPYILLATAQNKISGTSDSVIAAGTTTSAVNVVTPVSSQRELIALFGIPTFYTDTTGSVIQGSELNEYGLQTAYSVLGVTNQIYVQRVDINLTELIGTTVRPTNPPSNGTTWLDLVNTDFGIFEWTAADQVFNKIHPTVIDKISDTTGGVPNDNIAGPYAVVTTSTSNPVYYRGTYGWVLVGAYNWFLSSPVYIGTVANPTVTTDDTVIINGIEVVFTGGNLATAVNDINTSDGGSPITEVLATVVDNKIAFSVGKDATSNGTDVDGILKIEIGTTQPGTLLADLGIEIGTHVTLDVQMSSHTQVPEWKASDTTARPTGSVWVKTTSPNYGADFVINNYNDEIDEWMRIDSPLYYDDATAIKALDPTGGGLNISIGSLYVRYSILQDTSVTYNIFERAVKGATTIVGDQIAPTFTPGDQFTISVSIPGQSEYSMAYPITMVGADAASFVSDLLNAGIPNITAAVTTTGAISITHTAGGVMGLEDHTNTPLTDAGFSIATQYIQDDLHDPDTGVLYASNWVQTVYTASTINPSINPADGTYWNYTEIDDVDIMIHDGTTWKGYQNATDSRGYDLSVTNPDGPMVTASAPLTQSDGTPIELGDLWIDSHTLEKYPTIYRWTALGDTKEGWVLIDTADQTTENGIVFADARWDIDGTTDVITGELVSIVDLLTSDYVDLDIPEDSLYPRGTLLWNTRRSGFTVKQYVEDYFNDDTFVGTLPTETSTWRTASGLRSDGSPYMGEDAVRAIVVAAMKSGVDSSLGAREELNMFNLIATPGYPELISNMITLNIDRKETAFIIGDSPMTLPATSLDLQSWANNTSLADDNGTDGLVSNDEYLGVYYPAGLANDLNGNSIVMPTSYMALRTMIRSDNVSYPWIAAAGVRRGSVDNATSIGFIDADTSEYQSIAVGQGLRDVLYTARINPISVLPAVGITLYGQKTRSTQISAMDRINVARLVAHLRYVLSILAKPFIFEPNDKLTRDEIKQEIEKYMNELTAKRAVYDYLVVCDKTNNTPSRIDRNELWVDVAIEPVKAVEFIYIPIRIKNTGEI